MSIEVKDLSFAYGEREVLHGVSFKAEAGEFLSILGPNGVGKSTLFRCVLGLLRDYTGSITVEGRDAKSLSIREAAKLIVSSASSTRRRSSFFGVEKVPRPLVVPMSTMSRTL